MCQNIVVWACIESITFDNSDLSWYGSLGDGCRRPTILEKVVGISSSFLRMH